MASMMGETDSVRLLAEHGGSIHAADSKGMTPLAAACIANKLDTVVALLALGANQQPDELGNTPLMIVSYRGFNDIANVLLSFGVHVGATDLQGNTALDAAAFKGQTATLELLLTFGADVRHRNKAGRTVLFHAVKASNCLPTVRALLEAGADVLQKDCEGVVVIEEVDAWTPTCVPERQRQHAVLEMLKSTLTWSPDTHHWFPSKARQCVDLCFSCEQLPEDLWRYSMEFMPYHWIGGADQAGGAAAALVASSGRMDGGGVSAVTVDTNEGDEADMLRAADTLPRLCIPPPALPCPVDTSLPRQQKDSSIDAVTVCGQRLRSNSMASPSLMGATEKKKCRSTVRRN